jgi:hypothetical protein
MPRARSLTRLNYAEFRDDAFVEVASLLAEVSERREGCVIPKSPRFLQRGEGSRVYRSPSHHLHNPGENPKLSHARIVPIHDGGNRPRPLPGAGAA